LACPNSGPFIQLAPETAQRFGFAGSRSVHSIGVSVIGLNATRLDAAPPLRRVIGPVYFFTLVALPGFVVSNADLRLTADELLPPAAVDPAWRASLDGMRLTFPCFLTHLGLRGVSAADLEAAQGYYWAGWDADEVGRGALVVDRLHQDAAGLHLRPRGRGQNGHEQHDGYYTQRP